MADYILAAFNGAIAGPL